MDNTIEVRPFCFGYFDKNAKCCKECAQQYDCNQLREKKKKEKESNNKINNDNYTLF